MQKKFTIFEGVEISNEAMRVQQGLSQVVTDLDTRIGSIMNKSKDPVLRSGLEDLKLKLQTAAGDMARAIPIYEENKARALANSIDQAKKEPLDKPAPTPITPDHTNKVLTESHVNTGVKRFIMEGWSIEKPEISYEVEASPFDIKQISRAMTAVPKSSTGNVKIVISLIDQDDHKICYDTMVGRDEQPLPNKDLERLLWTGAVDDIKNEILNRIGTKEGMK